MSRVGWLIEPPYLSPSCGIQKFTDRMVIQKRSTALEGQCGELPALAPNSGDILAGRAGVLVGMLALGEGLPSSRSLGAARLAAWALLIVGVSALASGPGTPS